ncbi:hypothetical protein J4Q44_G00018230 [Coregonus suidteri]|uniref:Uncharacterized protein n=1 Tax=Coregonus suidteri TaxID=861788 RepID=A0AAN8R6T0_9TELE
MLKRRLNQTTDTYWAHSNFATMVISGPLQHAQESGFAGYSADMQHSIRTDHYPEKTSLQAESNSFVRPIPSKTQRISELNSYRTPGVPVTCANLPVQVPEDHQVISGHVKKKGQVDDFSTPGTDQRPTRPGGVSTVVKKMQESSGDHQSEMGVLAAPPLDTPLMEPHMSISMSAFEPETNPGKDAEAVPTRPSYNEALDLALVPKKSPAIMDGATGYKREATREKIATYKRDEESPNLKSNMAQGQVEGLPDLEEGLPLPVTQGLPVTKCVSEQAPRQRKKTTFYRRRGAGMEHVKYTVFLQFLIISALIQDSDGSCSACNQDGCAKVQTIYGSNDTILYQRSNHMEKLTSCSTTAAPPPPSQRCNLCLADTRATILFCSDSGEAAGLLDWEVDGNRLKNISVVDCPAMKTVPGATVVCCAGIGLHRNRKMKRDRQERRPEALEMMTEV